MIAVIAYQSLNSNSSTEHNLAASTGQVFQRKAHDMLAQKYPPGNSGALKYPTNPAVEPHTALQGPAELSPLADKGYMDGKNTKKRKRSDEDDGSQAAKRAKFGQTEMLSMVEGKARQIYQMSYRSMAQQCDLIVFGELDSAHTDWGSISSAAGASVHVSNQAKACNCFSVHGSDSTAQFISEGVGWCAAKTKGVLAVFVHVPNSIASQKTAAIKFYQDIKNTLLNTAGGGVVDVIIGDTNQPRESFSPDVISSGMDQKFSDGHAANSAINPADTWSKSAVTHNGTNSADSKKFDVAIYNTSTVNKVDVDYFSQLSFTPTQAAAYTDHMGVLVKVDKK